jgi:hypothetical protein
MPKQTVVFDTNVLITLPLPGSLKRLLRFFSSRQWRCRSDSDWKHFIGGPAIQLLAGLGEIGHETPRTLKGGGLKRYNAVSVPCWWGIVKRYFGGGVEWSSLEAVPWE